MKGGSSRLEFLTKRTKRSKKINESNSEEINESNAYAVITTLIANLTAKPFKV
jgi:hypothetical protein